MARRHARKRETITLDTISDFGPSVSRDRSGVLVSVGPAQVVMEDREDIAFDLNKEGRRPVVRGARRSDALFNLLKDDAITKHQYEAGNRFLDDLSRAQGSTSASFTNVVVSGGTSDGLTESQRQAIRAIERIKLMLGLNRSGVFWWVILDNRTPASYDTEHRMRHGTGVKWLKDDLDRLDEYYNPAGRGPERR